MSFDFLQDKSKKIHFIGIGGISMSGLAEILLKRGYSVSGSDRQNSQIVNKLKNMGAKIYIGHDASNISKNIDLVVYTAVSYTHLPHTVSICQLSPPAIFSLNLFTCTSTVLESPG